LLDRGATIDERNGIDMRCSTRIQVIGDGNLRIISKNVFIVPVEDPAVTNYAKVSKISGPKGTHA
jgi:hypothetical protein